MVADSATEPPVDSAKEQPCPHGKKTCADNEQAPHEMSSSFHWCQAMFPFRHGTYCGSFSVQCQTFAAQDCFRHHGGKGGARRRGENYKALRASLPSFSPCFAPQAMVQEMSGDRPPVRGDRHPSHRVLTGFTRLGGVEITNGFAWAYGPRGKGFFVSLCVLCVKILCALASLR